MDTSLVVHKNGNPIDIIPTQSNDFIYHEESMVSNNSLTQRDLMGLDKLMKTPVKSKRFKIKQFAIDDFAFEMNNPNELYNIKY